jgi:hypothetical protein
MRIIAIIQTHDEAEKVPTLVERMLALALDRPARSRG